MDKLGRNYFLKVQTLEGDFIEIRPPFTLEFDVSRNILTSANQAAMRIYNLSPTNRSALRKDVTDYDLRVDLSLQAGYGQNLPTIFQGTVKQAWSHRQKVDFITEIEGLDGGFAMVNGFSNQAFGAGEPNVSVLRRLMNDLPGVQPGTIGNFPGTLVRGASYSGRTADLLAELSDGSFFIDNGRANLLGDNECLVGEIDEITAATGLLGTPIRELNILRVEMMFEPRLILGQKIKLESSTANNFNGFYRVISLHHRGTISESVCGDALTQVGLAYGSEALEVIF